MPRPSSPSAPVPSPNVLAWLGVSGTVRELAKRFKIAAEAVDPTDVAAITALSDAVRAAGTRFCSAGRLTASATEPDSIVKLRRSTAAKLAIASGDHLAIGMVSRSVGDHALTAFRRIVRERPDAAIVAARRGIGALRAGEPEALSGAYLRLINGGPSLPPRAGLPQWGEGIGHLVGAVPDDGPLRDLATWSIGSSGPCSLSQVGASGGIRTAFSDALNMRVDRGDRMDRHSATTAWTVHPPGPADAATLAAVRAAIETLPLDGDPLTTRLDELPASAGLHRQAGHAGGIADAVIWLLRRSLRAHADGHAGDRGHRLTVLARTTIQVVEQVRTPAVADIIAATRAGIDHTRGEARTEAHSAAHDPVSAIANGSPFAQAIAAAIAAGGPDRTATALTLFADTPWMLRACAVFSTG